jgi:protein SCO1/2
MRKSQKIITTVLWSFLVLTMLGVVGRGMWRSRDAGPAASGIHIDGGATNTDGSGMPMLFEAPKFQLTDQNGKPFDSEQLKGKTWVAALIFTNCPGVCRSMTEKLKALQDAVPSKDVELVTFTVDPERDTPQVLKQYMQGFKADESRWHFLTGGKDKMFATAKGLKLAASPAEGNIPIQHAEQFLLVDGNGRVRGIYHSKDEEQLKQLTRDAAHLAGS